MLFKSLLLLSALLVSLKPSKAQTDKVVCFYASWATYRPGNNTFKPQNIDPRLCTHILYAFLGVSADGTLESLDPWNDINLGGFQNVNSLKQINPNLKTLFSIGGYNAGHAVLSQVVASSALRSNFVASCLTFFEDYGYDGVDIDWEYPEDADKESFVTLLQEMRVGFDEKGYTISVTVSGTPLSAYDVPEISKVADLINVMTYEADTTNQGVTVLIAPLYGNLSIDTSIHNWIDSEANASKLTITIPFYGRLYALEDEANHEVGAPATPNSGASSGYNYLCEFTKDWTRVWVEEAQVSYRYNGMNWVNFDDPESVGLKAKYAKDSGLGGVAVWSIDTDDFHGNCGTSQVLLHAINDNI